MDRKVKLNKFVFIYRTKLWAKYLQTAVVTDMKSVKIKVKITI